MRAVRLKGPGHASLGATGRALSWETSRGLYGRGHGPGAHMWGRMRRRQWSGKGSSVGRSGQMLDLLAGWVGAECEPNCHRDTEVHSFPVAAEANTTNRWL